MRSDRLRGLNSFVCATLVAVLACAERGIERPVIESVGTPPTRAAGDSLRIATANLWGVSVLGFDWATAIDERFAAMAERLAENAPELDVVMIQEAWKDSARRSLVDHPGVAAAFPFRVDAVAQPGGSGLVILSRFPIESADFHRFRAQGACIKFWEGDCLSGKGLLVVQIRLPGVSIWIGDTHLIACYAKHEAADEDCDQSDPNGADRLHQILEIRRTMADLIGPLPALLGGDFNMIRTSRHYAAMGQETFSRDSSLQTPPKPTTPDARAWTEPGDEPFNPSRIDYLWTRAGTMLRWKALGPARAIFTEPVTRRSDEEVPLSDHPIIAAEFCLVRVDDPSSACLPLDGERPISH